MAVGFLKALEQKTQTASFLTLLSDLLVRVDFHRDSVLVFLLRLVLLRLVLLLRRGVLGLKHRHLHEYDLGS